MSEGTNEFSFILKPAEHGVGVFATNAIPAETRLHLFRDEDTHVPTRNKEDVPEIFRQYCLSHENVLFCPKDFGHMEIGWYLNHSKNPNAYHREYTYYALRDIKSGEEITIDYNSFGEPEEMKEDYYKSYNLDF